MANAYYDIAFTEAVKAAQTHQGSRRAYGQAETRFRDNARLSVNEAEFITARDGFYLATVNRDDWPYIQYRGGQPGFVKVLDETHLAYADLRGNRQYITTGNVHDNPRTALFFMDYASQQRLKLFAETRAIAIADAGDLADQLGLGSQSKAVERIMLLTVKAFDWNCSQHITPRFTLEEFAESRAVS